MTPEARAELEQNLASHGLTVLLTRDYDAMLLHLARLAQFERLLIMAAENDPLCRYAFDLVEARRLPDSGPCSYRLEILDIPEILSTLNRVLNSLIDRQARINAERLPSAAAAFVGILCAEEE